MSTALARRRHNNWGLESPLAVKTSLHFRATERNNSTLPWKLQNNGLNSSAKWINSRVKILAIVTIYYWNWPSPKRLGDWAPDSTTNVPGVVSRRIKSKHAHRFDGFVTDCANSNTWKVCSWNVPCTQLDSHDGCERHFSNSVSHSFLVATNN